MAIKSEAMHTRTCDDLPSPGCCTTSPRRCSELRPSLAAAASPASVNELGCGVSGMLRFWPEPRMPCQPMIAQSCCLAIGARPTTVGTWLSASWIKTDCTATKHSNRLSRSWPHLFVELLCVCLHKVLQGSKDGLWANYIGSVCCTWLVDSNDHSCMLHSEGRKDSSRAAAVIHLQSELVQMQ